MATAIQNKYHWNPEREQWERVDKVQEYKGCEIATISYHRAWMLEPPEHHRGYRVKYPSGHESIWTIDKRGGNIKNLKGYIDFLIARNDPKMMVSET